MLGTIIIVLTYNIIYISLSIPTCMILFYWPRNITDNNIQLFFVATKNQLGLHFVYSGDYKLHLKNRRIFIILILYNNTILNDDTN